MIVEQHLPPLRGTRQRQHHLDRPTRHGADGSDFAILSHLGDKRDLPTAGSGDFGA